MATKKDTNALPTASAPLGTQLSELITEAAENAGYEQAGSENGGSDGTIFYFEKGGRRFAVEITEVSEVE